MRNVAIAISLLVVLLFAGSPAGAQPPAATRDEPSTKFERFTLTKGTVRVREYYEIGTVRGKYGDAIFSVARAYTPGQSDALHALQIETHETGRLERKRIGILDADEVAGLNGALPQILKMAQGLLPDQPPTTTTGIDFKGGSVKVTAFVKGGRSGIAIQAGDIGSVTAFFDLSDGPGIK
jgi:hypothetical protein